MNRINVALFFMFCAISFSVICLFQNHNSIDQTIYDAIELGMPENEAVALVPIAPRTIAFTSMAELLAEAGKTQFNGELFAEVVTAEPGVFLYFDATSKKELGKKRVWQTHEYGLQVLFSPDGKVMGKALCRFKDANARWWYDRLWFLP